MPSPSITFGFVLATLYGAAFHLVVGGDARRLALFLLAGWIGFVIGQIFGVIFAINAFDIGSLHILAATLGAFFALIVARLLTSDRLSNRIE